MNKRLPHIALSIVALACVLGFVKPSDAGFLEALTDTTSTAVTIHVGSPRTGSIPAGISAPVAVGASVSAPSTTKYLSLDKRALTISLNPGQSSTLICPLTLSVSSHGAAWVLSTVKVILTNNFHDWDFMARDMSIRIYRVGSRPTRPFMKLIDFADNNSEFTSFLNNRADSTWNSTYCVDLQLTVPASVAPGDYYNTLSWALYRSETFHGHTTPTPMPTPMPTPTPPPYVFAANSLFSGPVSDILVFDATANGNVPPLYDISSSDPSHYLVNPEDMRVGADGNLYVGDYATYNLPNSGVFVFAANSHGATAPLRYLDGGNTGIQTVQSIALDAANDLYVLTDPAGSTNAILRFAPGANGDVAPAAQLTAGSGTALWAPNGIASRPDGTLYVVNEVEAQYATMGNVVAFAPGASGNATPIATISGSGTQVGFPYGIDLDAQGNIYVLTNDNEGAASALPYQGSNSPATNPRICVYRAASNGNVAPIAVIEGPATLLVAPVAIHVAPDGGIYVAEHYSGSAAAAALYYYAPGSNGDVAPTRVISGSSTGFDAYGLQGLGL